MRELKNAVERAVVIARGDLVTEADLPARTREAPRAEVLDAPLAGPTAGAPVDFKERVRRQTRALETEMIVEALERSNGNQTDAARLLKMPARTLGQKMKELGIRKTFGQ